MLKIVFRFIKFIFVVFISCIVFIFINYKIISFCTSNLIYDDVKKLPGYSVILIPGVGDSLNNYYFKGRRDAAIEIYNSGKINTIIISGRNDLKGYDEPRDMFIALQEKGISPEIIIKDYGAERTIQSIFNLKNNNFSDSIIIVSQKSHLERALFLAKANEINAVGFIAKENLPEDYKKYYLIREIVARLRCTWDVIKLIFEI
ncbi:MAG: vancomycin high temperature exclusion protein [Bacteroidia bacterium]